MTIDDLRADADGFVRLPGLPSFDPRDVADGHARRQSVLQYRVR